LEGSPGGFPGQSLCIIANTEQGSSIHVIIHLTMNVLGTA
jgi:hypothetical protein